MGNNPLLLSILAALSGCGGETFSARGCIPAPEQETTCPSRASVDPDRVSLPDHCGDDLEVVAIQSEGTLEEVDRGAGPVRSCCYQVKVVDHDSGRQCDVGRPYYEHGTLLRSPLQANAPADVAGVAAVARRAAAWANAGAAEHASVAAFARLALQLMARGAPSELVRDAHRAALDELGHAGLCWTLARRFGAAAQSAGPFPFTAPIAVDVGLAELAAETVRDGCLQEALGAHLAAVAAAAAPEPDVRAALGAIAEEESAHAVLSFRIVAWALRVGGPDVRAAVETAFAEPHLEVNLGELALRTGVDRASLAEAAGRALREVLEPARDHLLSM